MTAESEPETFGGAVRLDARAAFGRGDTVGIAAA